MRRWLTGGCQLQEGSRTKESIPGWEVGKSSPQRNAGEGFPALSRGEIAASRGSSAVGEGAALWKVGDSLEGGPCLREALVGRRWGKESGWG